MEKVIEYIYTKEKENEIFYRSTNLQEIEDKLNENLNINQTSKITICIALSQIKSRELYKQSGADSFKSYMQTHRIPINYSTALDYSIIGDNYLRYEPQLIKVNFSEKDGLKKLLFLHKAVINTCQTPIEIFNKIKQLSLREFKRYALGISIRDLLQENRLENRFKFKIKIDDEVIFLTPSNIEIIWLNRDLGQKLGIPNLYKDIQAYLLTAVKQFFEDKFGSLPE